MDGLLVIADEPLVQLQQIVQYSFGEMEPAYTPFVVYAATLCSCNLDPSNQRSGVTWAWKKQQRRLFSISA